MNIPTASQRFEDIIVVVHGIGDQDRYATVRSAATRFANSKALLSSGQERPVAPQPLGYFHSEVRSITSVRPLDDAARLQGTDLASIGFAEVYWADIPREAVNDGHTLEETKAWAYTVVARAKGLYDRAHRDPEQHRIVPPDFALAGEVLEEIIETVYVLENLTFLAQKAGVLTLNLRKVLEDYVGDVQLVAEFRDYSTDIVGRFHRAMESVYAQQEKLGNREVRLHIVAHSEGTVVSFLGMLHAMSQHRLSPADPPRQPEAKIEKLQGPRPFPSWLSQVRGFMTIGSPIDKHLLLWPGLWENLEPKRCNAHVPAGQIRWRNYYDYGDPVGFKLDTARLWLQQKGCKSFQFCGCPKCKHDIGFARYMLPGEAHNEYWNDPAVFEDFIAEAIRPVSPRRPPGDKWLVASLSPALPYVLSFLILAVGTFVLYKAIHAYTNPTSDPLQRFVRFTQLGVKPALDYSGGEVLCAITGVTALIAGATLLARFPRLAFGPRWKIWGIIAFLAGCVCYIALVSPEIRNEIGGKFWWLRRYVGDMAKTFGILAVAAVAGMSGYLVMARKVENPDRRKRWLLRGMRPLILCGAVALALIVTLQMLPRGLGRHLDLPDQAGGPLTLTEDEVQLVKDARLSPDELIQIIKAQGTNWTKMLSQVQPVLATHPPAWPVVLTGAMFLYLWWLATLLFDLAFVWHRYIRRSTTNNRLQEWNAYSSAPRGEGKQKESCSLEKDVAG